VDNKVRNVAAIYKQHNTNVLRPHTGYEIHFEKFFLKKDIFPRIKQTRPRLLIGKWSGMDNVITIIYSPPVLALV